MMGAVCSGGDEMALKAQPQESKHTSLVQLQCLCQDLRGYATDCEKGLGVHDRLSQMQVEIVRACSDLLVEVVGGSSSLARLVSLRDTVEDLKERPPVQ